MKIKLLTTALVLGLSSVAFAAPGNKPLHYGNAPHGPMLGRGELHRPLAWTSLSSLSRIRGKQTINVRGLKAYSKLKLDSTMGTTFIDKVVIVFGNGATQTVNLDKNLAARAMPLTIDLDGRNRRISKVVVYGKSSRRAAISVLAG